jgi:hypothetical protein
MEIFGGFMVMLSIIGFFLTVLWFVLPFVVFGIKGKVDRAVELLEQLDRRLAVLERQLAAALPAGTTPNACATRPDSLPAAEPGSSGQE